MATAGVINNSTQQTPRTGAWYAWLNGYGVTHTDTLFQQITVPSSANTRDAEFLAQDHLGRDDNHNSLRHVASASSQFQQHGADDSCDLLKLEQVDRLRVEDFRSDCL